ncbi:MAG: hypothetical protein NVS2B5_22110 [Beijerinckiaceae bacterium]
MAKVMTAKVKLQCPGGQATPAPPVGPALGQHGVNIGQFVMQFNDRTKDMKGTTIPVVPRIDRPPWYRRRPLSVRLARSSPPGIEISISTSAGAPSTAAASPMAWRIIARGTGLIAGSPGATGNPARVTVPTPSPALNEMPAPGRPCRTVTMTSAPCVTSGSSPASLTMPARAKPSPRSCSASAKAGRAPCGRVMETGSGKRPVTRASNAARVAAAAQVPVVQPRRRCGLLASSSMP